MIIRCIGHACFVMELDNGMRLVTDPYDDSCGYPVQSLKADAALVSHHHHDHAAVETVDCGKVIDQAGVHTLAADVKVTAVKAYHDNQGGALRGETLLFLVEAEGLRVAHLGDLGHLPTKEQIAALAPVDVLMVPVGGHFTIDAQEAQDTARLLQARVILPMHYRTEATAGWPIGPVEDFTRLFLDKPETLNLLRVSQGDLACQPHLAVLKPQSLAK